MKKVELVKELLKITFNGLGFNMNLNLVKSLSGRKFVGKTRPVYWTCPPSFENIEKLIEWEFNLDKKVITLFDKMNEKVEVQIDSIPGFERMYPFQLKGVEFLEMMGGRALIGDEMGLGKTIQALGYLALHPELRPAVIICPASLKLNWEKEIWNWMQVPALVLSGNYKKLGFNHLENIIVINYDILDSWADFLVSLNPSCLIIDEAHMIKNQKAKRSKAVKKLAKKVDHVIGLTGTPIINRPSEFFAILNLLNKNEWPSFWGYAHKYCGAKHNGFGWDFNGSSNVEKLNEALKRTMIRRLKSEVLPELPAKVRTVIPLEITNRAEYNKAVQDFADLMDSDSDDTPPAVQLTRIEALKQLVVEGKIKACINWISDFLESGEKLVVFCTHKKVVNQLMDEFGHMGVKVDGSVKTTDRHESVRLFQEHPECKVFIGNIKAAGVGLTLTAASSTAFIELPWEPAAADQAEDRVHRIGQEADSVNAYYLLGQNTIDMEIAELLDEKRKVLDSVLDGKETEETGLLTELMNRIMGD